MRILVPLVAGLCAGLCLLVADAASAQQPVSGSLGELRAEALAAVNRDRLQHGLGPLSLSDRLNAAAKKHAADMFDRHYFDHISPEGKTVGDRYRAEGGSDWTLVEENIAVCNGCPALPARRRIDAFERGWMESPGHRENILQHGITEFGFGMVGREGGSVVAVQTFAGPGHPRGTHAAQETSQLSPSGQVERIAALINARRRGAGLAPLQTAAGLSGLAGKLVSNDPDNIVDPQATADMENLLPQADRDRYDDLQVLGSRCGGCGLEATAADVDWFARYWLEQDARTVLSGSSTRLGFVMQVDGAGMKSAVLVLAQSR